MSIVTKAKLDEITVAGECQCEEKVKPIVEVVVLVDGSDSYNNKGILKLYQVKKFIFVLALLGILSLPLNRIYSLP